MGDILKKSLLIGSCCFAILAANNAFAKDSNNPDDEIVIVTATRMETKTSLAPGNVSVVTKKDLELLGRPSLAEMVRNLEGITSGLYRGQADQIGEMLIRGMSSQSQSMVLIDNIPVQTSYAGSAQALGGVSVDDVERVEIVRGPFSSLYGSSAMGGVINYVTAFPKKNETRFTIAYGNAFDEGRAQKNLVRGTVALTRQFGDSFRVKFGYGWSSSDGYNSDWVTTSYLPSRTGFITQKTTTGGTQYIVGSRGYGSFDKQDFNLKAQANITSNDTVDFWAAHSELDYEYLNPQTYLKDANGNPTFSSPTSNTRSPIIEASFLNTSQATEVTNDLISLSWKHNFANSKLSVQASNLYVDEWYRTPGSTSTTTFNGGPGVYTPRTSENTIIDILWQKEFPIGLVLLGGQYKTTKATADTYDMSNWKDNSSLTTFTTSMGGYDRTLAAFFDYHWKLQDKLSGTLGLRFENWKTYDGYTLDFTKPNDTSLNQHLPSNTLESTTPKATAAYQISDNSRVKASWGQAFRAPDARSLYRTYYRGTVLYNANPFLKPEKSESFDIGYEYSFSKGGIFKLYAFQNEITDMISSKTISATYVERINIGKSRIKGIEAAFNIPLPYNFKLNSNYTYMDSKVIDNPTDLASVGKQLTSIPKEMANIGISYDNKKFFGSLNYQYASKRYFNTSNNDIIEGVYGAYDAYNILNAKLGYRYNDNVTLSLAVSNLTDETIYNSVITEGRSWYLQLSTKF